MLNMDIVWIPGYWNCNLLSANGSNYSVVHVSLATVTGTLNMAII